MMGQQYNTREAMRAIGAATTRYVLILPWYPGLSFIVLCSLLGPLFTRITAYKYLDVPRFLSFCA